VFFPKKFSLHIADGIENIMWGNQGQKKINGDGLEYRFNENNAGCQV
jgi:hypothetical protein